MPAVLSQILSSSSTEHSFKRIEDGDLQSSDLYPQFKDLTPIRLESKPRPAEAEEKDAQPEAAATPSPAVTIGIVFAGEEVNIPVPPVNIVAGIFSYLDVVAPGSSVIGFKEGPPGLLADRWREVTREEVADTMNHGVWLQLGYGSASSSTSEARKQDARKLKEVCEKHSLDGLVCFAPTKELGWTAAMAHLLVEAECSTTIVAVPYSKNLNVYVPEFLPITLGFDSARRSLCEVAGNVFVDCLSSNKYWHFMRCFEDAVTIEVGLQTRCAQVLLTKGGLHDTGTSRLMDEVNHIRRVIQRRAEMGRRSGGVLLSRKMIETLPEMDELKNELLDILGTADEAKKAKPPTSSEVQSSLQQESTKVLFKRLPRFVKQSLLSRRDSSGLPLLPTNLEGERIIGRFVQQELQESWAAGTTGTQIHFAPRFHHFELMSSPLLPTQFDCTFGYTLGHTVAALVREKRTFYVAACAKMHLPVSQWEPCAVPFHLLLREATGSPELPKVVKVSSNIRPKLLEVFKFFSPIWEECNAYKALGHMQFGGDVGPMEARPLALLAEYLSVEELKAIIQPVMDLPPPLEIDIGLPVVRDMRVPQNMSLLERQRLEHRPALPSHLRGNVTAQEEDITPQTCDDDLILAKTFPYTHPHRCAIKLDPVPVPSVARQAAQADAVCGGTSSAGSDGGFGRVGVVFGSSQVPGFHTVVAGIYEQLASRNPPVELIGFVGGYVGLLKNLFVPITKHMVDTYLNLGGQDLLCHFGDVTVLRYTKDLRQAITTMRDHQLLGLIVLGNLEVQVDAAFLTEACMAEKVRTRIITVPLTLDCDIPFIQQSIGFDTGRRTLASFVGNIGNEAQASGNRWIFVRILGSASSHLAVQCALDTHATLVLFSASRFVGRSLTQIVNGLCDLIMEREREGTNHGIVLIPAGFAATILELRVLFAELKEIFKTKHYETSWDSISDIAAKFNPSTAEIFKLIPRDVQYEILFGARERHSGVFDVMNLSSERLLLRFVELELLRRTELGIWSGNNFSGHSYTMAYSLRSAIPTDFDCDLAYTLGFAAAVAVQLGRTGLMVHAENLEKEVEEWRVCGLPLTCLLNLDVDIESGEQKVFAASSSSYILKRGKELPLDVLPEPAARAIVYQGPPQYQGEDFEARQTWYMLQMAKESRTQQLRDIAQLCGELHSLAALAKAESTLYAVNKVLHTALSVLVAYKHLSDLNRQGKADGAAEEAMSRLWQGVQMRNLITGPGGFQRTGASRLQGLVSVPDLIVLDESSTPAPQLHAFERMESPS